MIRWRLERKSIKSFRIIEYISDILYFLRWLKSEGLDYVYKGRELSKIESGNLDKFSNIRLYYDILMWEEIKYYKDLGDSKI
jgi:hypothetical protein